MESNLPAWGGEGYNVIACDQCDPLLLTSLCSKIVICCILLGFEKISRSVTDANKCYATYEEFAARSPVDYD